VNLILKSDKKRVFRFAAMQSRAGQEILSGFGLPLDDFDSMVLVEDGKVHTKSTAVLRIVRRMGGLWPVFYPLIFLPRALRDAGYSVIARNRYRWFGKRDVCMVPTDAMKERFLA
jgi:predicted DCC family thiol-disulfide oxidoreductase YuxK